MQSKTNERCQEFLRCLGHGKTIYELEAENNLIDKRLQTKTKNKVKINIPLPPIKTAFELLQINLKKELKNDN